MTRIKVVWSRLLALLSSSRTALWLMIAWLALMLVWVLPFILTGQRETTVTLMAAEWLPFRFVYALLSLTSLACAVRRFSCERANSCDPSLGRRPSDGEGVLAADCSIEDARALLAAQGFHTSANGEGTITLSRHRWATHGGSLFHLGITLVAAALLVNSLTVSSTSFSLVEGQSTADFLEKSGGSEAKAPLMRLVRDLSLKDVDPRFFGEELLLERLDATVLTKGRSRKLSLARPLWMDPVTLMSIRDFELAPRFVVRDENGAVAEDTVVAMDLFPPGKNQSVLLRTAKADLNLRLYADTQLRGGKAVSDPFSLGDAKLLVTATSRVAGVPDRIVARRTLAVGDSLSVNDFNVTIAELKTAGTMRVTRAPALPFVVFAALMMCGGLIVRVLFRRTDVVLTSTGDGVSFVAHEDLLGAGSGERRVARILANEGRSR